MKFIRLATIAALSTSILAGGATVVLAQETREVETDSTIQFRPFDPDKDEDGELIVDPPVTPEEGGPDVEIEPEVEGTTGPLSIVKAATMNFGSQVISNQDQTYNMIAEMQPLRETGELVPYVSFAQVQDLRGTNEGWDLKASLSDFESNSQNNILTGAEITFVDTSIHYGGSNQDNAPSAHTNGLRLLPNGSVSVMTAETGQGAGVSSIRWGNQADLNAQFADDTIEVVENEAIQLSIPGSTAKDEATYEATLTWELTSTPGEEI
ncbi:WxL domain-containing protein [Enterococcus mundtii]